MDAVAAMGGRIICSYEPLYPDSLAAIADPPPVLTVLGDIRALSRPCIGIVGTRNASLNGRRMAGVLAHDLGKSGYVVVSGLARGIDTAAHEAALQNGFPTIAVIAGGVDTIYPRENEKLHHAIIKSGSKTGSSTPQSTSANIHANTPANPPANTPIGGAVISEAPLGTQPNAKLFPRRNRIVSGLSLGIVVVEAALRSGSLITARQALDQGREVFAVPGFPLDPRAEGPNSLIQQGARLVTNAAVILEDVAGMSFAPPPQSTLFEDPDRFEGVDVDEEDGLLDAALLHAMAQEGARTPSKTAPSSKAPPSHGIQPAAIHSPTETPAEAVLSILSPAPIGIDDLIRASGLDVSVVQMVLMELELSGKLERLTGNRVALLPDVA